ncbi:hypothetical protein WR25_06829 [Diploscapter pachys]|uniref:RING-type domain-containing protein n=1 Tax=Diploscapter pachys TaxID=2018661 RepID=A0A2A2JHL5_9BILA|nr:hypothetical protein WR25_06829 [Diploscapter pachys]
MSPSLDSSTLTPTPPNCLGKGNDAEEKQCTPSLRESFSVAGVNTASKTMAVGASGQLLVFKGSATELLCYDVTEHSTTVFQLSKKDPLFDDCQIYDLAFSRNGSLIVCLQRPSNSEFYICEGTIDAQECQVDISGNYYKTEIHATKGRKITLLQDEAGVVLISHPITWNVSSGQNYLELFHASNFLSSKAGSKYTIMMQTNEKFKNDQITLSCPVIYRNHLYLFFADDFSKFLLVPLSGTLCGKCQLRRVTGIAPSASYMTKNVQAYEDYLLLYANQHLINLKPTLYIMNLSSLQWLKANLSLSSHYPNGNVSLQKGNEETVFLHGDCHQRGCQEKSHLYQINVETITASLKDPFSVYPTVYSSTRVIPPVMQRYRKKQEHGDTFRRRLNSLNCVVPVRKSSLDSCVSSSPDSQLNSSNDTDIDKVKNATTCSTHWSADMAENTQTSVMDQFKKAQEMGFEEGVILEAFNLNCEDRDGIYRPFESANQMLDFLNRVSNRSNEQQNRPKLAVYDSIESSPSSRSSFRVPSRSAVSRSSSFHMGSSRLAKSDSHDINRMVMTFEKEKERDKREVENQFSILKTRIHVLEYEKQALKHEKDRVSQETADLRRTVESQTSIIQTEREEKERLQKELDEEIQKNDKLTIECLRCKDQIVQQKELADHRKRQHDEEIAKKDEEIRTLQEKCRQLEQDLDQKMALLDEQTEIARRMEQKNSSLQSDTDSRNVIENYQKLAVVFERLMEKTQPCFDSISQSHERLIHEQSDVNQKLQAEIDKLKEDIRKKRERYNNDRQNLHDELEAKNREMKRLTEKIIMECCICLTKRPSTLFQPCNHLVVCDECNSDNSINECPTCRKAIQTKIKVFH